MNLYYGRECVDKNRFLFDRIGQTLASFDTKGKPERVVLLVPDQYTLQAERDAFYYLGVKGFLDLEILSQSRLADRIFSETGGSKRVHIDQHGRHMLLSKLLSDASDQLTAFRGMGRSHSFLDMANDLISEMKQYNAGVADLDAIIESMEDNTLLKRKLSDIALIYRNYEEAIEGRYLDTEDFISLFLSKISQSDFVKQTTFFVTGFDSFTPKNRDVLLELERYGKGLHVVLTADDSCRDQELFQITRELMNRLMGDSPDPASHSIPIREHLLKRSPALRHLEQELFSYPFQPYQGEERTSSVHLCRAANYYAEAETAAQFIATLVREEGYRYREIAVICNDMEVRGSVIKRVFAEYGISFFMDQKRTVLHDPAIAYLLSLLSVMTEGWAYEDVFTLLKTDFSPIERDAYESLENYVIRYKIRGNRWKKPFQFGKKEFDERELSELNETREEILSYILALEKPFQKAKTVREKTEALTQFLREQADLPGRIEALVEELNQEEAFESALELAQIWEGLLLLLEQLVELIGEEEIEDSAYLELLKVGVESLEVGLIPSTVDQVVVGTMQRTRVGKLKALLVLGANDGVLPAAASGDDLLSQDEKTLLWSRGVEICRDDDRRMMEERLAIYKNLSKPEQHLWMSYSASDPEGKELRPSIIFDRIRQLYPTVPVEKDLLNREDVLGLIERPGSSLHHLSEALRTSVDTERELAPAFQAAFNWYLSREDQKLSMIREGFSFDNRLDRLDQSIAKGLYQKRNEKEQGQPPSHLVLSPSRLEKFGRCPFAHLVLYGLAPEERRLFEVAGREAGDVYHECLMRLSRSLTVPGIDITAEESPWMSLSREECDRRVDEILLEIAGEYKEGMLLSGEEEQYRMERIREVCRFAAFAMVEHVKQGHIREVYFEEGFGANEEKLFPPIKVRVGKEDILIEGKIDRVDVLPGDYVKIVDYKSGKERFDIGEAKAGWRLQLMLYLRAAVEGLQEQKKEGKPAGIFYFEIADPLVDVSALEETDLGSKVESELRKAFRLDGILLDDQEVIDHIAGEFSEFSDILPIRKNKDGEVKGTAENKLLSAEDFEALRATVDQTIETLCTSLADGVIDIHPKKTKYETACKYCSYKSICNFELSFDGCSYDVVK